MYSILPSIRNQPNKTGGGTTTYTLHNTTEKEHRREWRRTEMYVCLKDTTRPEKLHDQSFNDLQKGVQLAMM
jgi:hypothetical protein